MLRSLASIDFELNEIKEALSATEQKMRDLEQTRTDLDEEFAGLTMRQGALEQEKRARSATVVVAAAAGPRLFECPFCEREFDDKDTLRMHILLKHNPSHAVAAPTREEKKVKIRLTPAAAQKEAKLDSEEKKRVKRRPEEKDDTLRDRCNAVLVKENLSQRKMAEATGISRYILRQFFANGVKSLDEGTHARLSAWVDKMEKK